MLIILLALLMYVVSKSWTPGRQKTGYLKKTLMSFSFMDLHILKFPPCSYAPPHVDVIPDRQHHRINIIIPWFSKGGQLYVLGRRRPWFTYFRSDTQRHAVLPVTKGTVYMISLGVFLW